MSDLRTGGRSSRGLAIVALASCALAAPVAGQVVLNGRERLDFDRPEAWGMKFAASAATFGALDAPRSLSRGEIEAGVEAGSVPRLSASERRIGFNGTKEEAIDRTSVVGRLCLAIGLGHGLVGELFAIPPVQLDGVEPRVAGVAVSAKLAESARLRVGSRLEFDHGTLTGDITCSRDEVAAGSDPSRNPLGCQVPSTDRLEFDLVSAELAVSLRPASDQGWEPYFAAAAHRLSGSFQVRARYQGLIDRTRLDTRGTYWSATLGAAVPLEHRFRFTGELFYAPLSIRRPGRGASSTPLGSFRVSIRRGFR
jgi:hypothetical protein